MKPLGIGNYSVIETTTKKIAKSRFNEMHVIQARFRDLHGREVQSLERQFLSPYKMYVVTFLLDAPALSDRSRIDVVLDFFQPVYLASRMPASVTETLTAPSGTLIGGEKIEVPPIAAIHELNMRDPASLEICRKVPKERLRSPDDFTFTGRLYSKSMTIPKCLQGAWDNAWGPRNCRRFRYLLWCAVCFFERLS